MGAIRLSGFACALVAGSAAILSASGCGSGGTATPPPSHHEPKVVRRGKTLTGTIRLVDQTWHCNSPVNLDLVRVEMHDVAKDAVRLGTGCTGVIRRLDIPGDGGTLGPGGDGVKVHNGAHDLRILGGSISCGAKSGGKHQDGIQAMGGLRVTFERIVSQGCANSFMFINTGRSHHGVPNGIVCRDCRATSRNYSVFVGSSVASGAVGGSFRSRAHPRRTAAAVRPVLVADRWVGTTRRERRRS